MSVWKQILGSGNRPYILLETSHKSYQIKTVLSLLQSAQNQGHLDHNSLFILYCSLIVPYITYCVEVCGNTYKTSTNSIFILHQRVIRIVGKSVYNDKPNNYKPNQLIIYEFICLKMYGLCRLQNFNVGAQYRISWLNPWHVLLKEGEHVANQEILCLQKRG